MNLITILSLSLLSLVLIAIVVISILVLSAFSEIPGKHRASSDGQKFEDDRRAGQDLVPKQADKVEVSEIH